MQATATVSAAASAVNQIAISGTTVPVQVYVVPPHVSSWEHTVTLYGTPAVALVAACIAGLIQLRQWGTAKAAAETARNKLKLDLFDKRWAIYEAGLGLINDSFLSDVEHDYTMRDWDKLKELQKQLNGANWLLDEQVSAFLMKIGFEAELRHRKMIKRGGQPPVEQSRDEWVQSMQERTTRVLADSQQLNKLFGPFLAMRH
jgi:hypothetical protein